MTKTDNISNTGVRRSVNTGQKPDSSWETMLPWVFWTGTQFFFSPPSGQTSNNPSLKVLCVGTSCYITLMSFEMFFNEHTQVVFFLNTSLESPDVVVACFVLWVFHIDFKASFFFSREWHNIKKTKLEQFHKFWKWSQTQTTDDVMLTDLSRCLPL